MMMSRTRLVTARMACPGRQMFCVDNAHRHLPTARMACPGWHMFCVDNAHRYLPVRLSSVGGATRSVLNASDHIRCSSWRGGGSGARHSPIIGESVAVLPLLSRQTRGLSAGCGDEEGGARLGDSVTVHYRGMLIDGRVFMDTEKSKDGPVVFTLGEKKVIEGMEASVLGMRVGETKTAQLCPEEAFGDIRADLILHIPTENIPADVLTQVQTGKLLRLTEQAQGEVLAKTERGVTVDLNHPLAGETVVFELNIVSIMPAR